MRVKVAIYFRNKWQLSLEYALGSCVTTATTRLKSAVWSGDYYEVKSLIESGADVNVRDSRD
jgi:hypothetical protein